jgi:hypothetical protein
MNKTRIVIVAVTTLLLLGCDELKKVAVENLIKPEIERLSAENKKLQDEISASKSKIGLIEIINKIQTDRAREFYKRLNSLESRVRDSATIDFVSKGYSRVDTESGFLLLVFHDVQPFADGAKVILEIGNPLAVNFRGLRIKAKWGRREPEYKDDTDSDKWLKDYEDWGKSLHKKEFDLTDVLRSEYWNRISLILPDTKVNDLGYLNLTLETNQVSMRQAK